MTIFNENERMDKLGVADATLHKNAPLALAPDLAFIPDRFEYPFATPASPLGNDLINNCVEAAILNLAQIRTTVAAGSTWTPDMNLATKLYSDISGYVPKKNDPGTEIQAAQEYCFRTGVWLNEQLLDVMIPLSIPQNNINAMKHAVVIYGGIGLILRLPLLCMRTESWNSSFPDTIIGNHMITVFAYDKNTLYGTSWGRRVSLTIEFTRRFNLGAIAFLSRDWFDHHGYSPFYRKSWEQLRDVVNESWI